MVPENPVLTWIKKYSKGLMQVLATVAVAIAGFSTSDGMSTAEWLQVGATAIATVGVVWKAQIQNDPYAKAIMAAAGAIAAAVIAAWSDNMITGQEWLNVALAALGAFGVWAIPTTATVKAVPERYRVSG